MIRTTWRALCSLAAAGSLFVLQGCGGGPGPECHYTLSMAGGGVPASGGDMQVKVEAPAGCAWGFTSDESWISVHDAPPAPAGNGNGTVVATIAANTGMRRVGNAVIAFHRVTIDQAGSDGAGSCTFAIFPATGTAPAADATGAFAVVPNAPDCSWWVEAHSPDDDWIDHDFHQGIGPGIATYTVAPSSVLPTLPLPRTGRIGLHDSTNALVVDHVVTQEP